MEPTTRTNTRFPLMAAAGVILMAAGLGWDAVLHGRDPDLAAREGLVTLANPGHLLMGAGLALTTTGVLGGLLALRGRLRLAAVTGVLLALVAGAAALAMPHDAGHEHAAMDSPGHGHAVTAPDTAAAAFLAQVKDAVAKYADESVALGSGYRPNPNAAPNARARHYANPAFHRDDAYADPSRPEGLVYSSRDDGSKVLLGAVFKVPASVKPPDIGSAVWHTHAEGCEMHDEDCFAPHMLHAWIGDDVRDPFADNYRLALWGSRSAGT